MSVALPAEPELSEGMRLIDRYTILDKIGSNNRKGEFYLTDAVAIARAMKLKAVAIETEEDE